VIGAVLFLGGLLGGFWALVRMRKRRDEIAAKRRWR
jgi:hypothetical protein